MAQTNVGAMTTTAFDGSMENYAVDPIVTESATGEKETSFQHTMWSQYYGYYRKIPELKKAIDIYATWSVGQGYTADPETTVILEHITGWGEDTANSIFWNLMVTKKILGDAFAEIIRDEDTGELINLKVLDPSTIKIIADEKGVIKRYEQTSKIDKKIDPKIFEPNEILHLCNDRVADALHGTGVVESCETVILTRNEAMDDWRKVLHRNVVPVRIIEVDTDNPAKIAKLRTEYEAAIKKGEVLIIPKGNVSINESQAKLQDSLSTIKYYENFFYQALGIPKIITGGSEEFTEASSKIAFLTFEMVYKREQEEFEKDIWNQLYMKLKFNAPVSLKNEMLQSEQKQPNYGVGMQPSEMQVGRNE